MYAPCALNLIIRLACGKDFFCHPEMRIYLHKVNKIVIYVWLHVCIYVYTCMGLRAVQLNRLSATNLMAIGSKPVSAILNPNFLGIILEAQCAMSHSRDGHSKLFK